MDEIGDHLDEKYIMKIPKIEMITIDHLQIAKKIIKSQLHDIIRGVVITIFHHVIVYIDDCVVLCLYDMIKINEI